MAWRDDEIAGLLARSRAVLSWPPVKLTLPFVCLAMLASWPADAASELRLHFSALQRMLSDQAFTQDGRRYVKGSRDSKCSYAYLEHPQVDAAGDGRLRIRARFSGRSALDVFGHCLGFGDDFDVVITASPYFKDGSVRLGGVQVQPASTGMYARRVSKALTESLPEEFVYPASAEARRAIETATVPGYRRELRRFEVTRIVITPDALVLTVDFELAITSEERR
jgi:hypothetical protein